MPLQKSPGGDIFTARENSIFSDAVFPVCVKRINLKGSGVKGSLSIMKHYKWCLVIVCILHGTREENMCTL